MFYLRPTVESITLVDKLRPWQIPGCSCIWTATLASQSVMPWVSGGTNPWQMSMSLNAVGCLYDRLPKGTHSNWGPELNEIICTHVF